MKRIRWYASVLLDRVFGALVGQPCDLCRQPTTRVDWVTWCPGCFAGEIRRWGL